MNSETWSAGDYDRSFMRPGARGERVEAKIWRQQRDAGFASALCRARGFKGKHKDCCNSAGQGLRPRGK